MNKESLLETIKNVKEKIKISHLIFFAIVSAGLLYIACILEDHHFDLQSTVKNITNTKEKIGGVAPYYEGHDDEIEPNPHNNVYNELEQKFHKTKTDLSSL